MVASIIDKVPEDVYEALKELGVPAHIQGYNYLAYAINLVVENPSSIQGVTKIIYPSVAKEFVTMPTRVERSIRHAIEVVFKYYLEEDILKKYFGNSLDPCKGKPTNSQFIASIAHYVRKNRISE